MPIPSNKNFTVSVLLTLFILMSLWNCGGENRQPAAAGPTGPKISPNNPDFERANFHQEASGTSKIVNRFELNPKAGFHTGDFLSRIWANFGPPDEVLFEGFIYAFKDKKSGLIFTAYSAGSGPAYGGFREDKDKLKPLLEKFEKLLQGTKPVDCEITYQTDYGWMRCGAKGGKPFQGPAS